MTLVHPFAPSRAAASLLLVLPLLALAGCAEDGTATRLEIRFGGEPADAAYDVDSDLSSRPTADRYAQDGVPHPDAYTAHDQLEDWSRQTGRSYAATAYPDTGFGAGYFLTSLDGVEADADSSYWALFVDGQESTVGMSQTVVAEGTVVAWALTTFASAATLDPDPLGVTIDPPAPTQGETATITGSADQPVTVSIDGGPSVEVTEAGRWELPSPPLDFGQTPAVLRITDGTHDIREDVVFVRLASFTFDVSYTMATPPHAASSDTVWLDIDSFPSAPLYADKVRPHPGYVNVHDVMVAWTTQTGTVVDYSYSESFDFGVERIDGVGQPLTSSAPPWWGYKVNGETAGLGITLQAVAPGDAIAWDFATGT